MAILAVLSQGIAAMAQEGAQYHTYGEMTKILQNMAGAGANLVKLESIGKTLEKRDIWALQIANPAGNPVGGRPALLIAANLEGDHLIGSEIALGIADHLLKNYSANANIKQRLDNCVIYIIPRVNPDAAERMWAPVKTVQRANLKPDDEDHDGRIDEDGPEDLNKDGIITVMRVKDPNGLYMIDPEESRLMKKADSKKGEKGEYALYWEGIDHDQDGFIAEDKLGGVNINRNFMHEYPNYKSEAGPYMVSELETRAMLDFVLAHRNIAAMLTFGESDNLVTAPNPSGRLGTPKQIDLVEFANAGLAEAGKVGMFASTSGRLFGRFGGGGGGGGGGEMIFTEEMAREFSQLTGGGGSSRSQGSATSTGSGRMQMPARTAATTVNSGDIDYYRTISTKYSEMTGIKQVLVAGKPEGAFFQYGYFQYGVPSFTTPGWGLAEAPRGQGMPGGIPGGAAPAPEGGSTSGSQRASQFAALMGRRGGGGPSFPGAAGGEGQAGGEPQSQAVDRQLLQWMDKEKIEGFVPWTKFQHPDLGEVEIGGFKPYMTVNPPAAKIAELGKTHADFVVYLTSLFPGVKIAKLEAANLGGGLFRIKAEVENSGYLPTSLAHAVIARAVKPTMVQIQVPPDNIISGNTKTNQVALLSGSGGRSKFEWLIKAKAGESIELKVVSQKGGADKRSVALQ